MEDWNEYLLILAIYRANTLRGAANYLGTTHTTVARRLDAMQRRRKAIVFEKCVAGYKLTALGKQLVLTAEKCETLLIESKRHERALGTDFTGVITLSIPEPIAQYLLLETLIAFREQHPNIELNVHCSTEVVDLDRAEADVVVRGAQTLPEHLVGRRLYSCSVAQYAHRDYLRNTPEDKLRWIAPSYKANENAWIKESPYPTAPVGIAISEIVTRFKALEAKLGMARAACFMAQSNPNLIRLPDSPIFQLADIWVLTHPNLRDTPRIARLTQFLYDALLEKQDIVYLAS